MMMMKLETLPSTECFQQYYLQYNRKQILLNITTFFEHKVSNPFLETNTKTSNVETFWWKMYAFSKTKKTLKTFSKCITTMKETSIFTCLKCLEKSIRLKVNFYDRPSGFS